MSWDRSWQRSKARLKLDRVKEAAASVAAAYAGVTSLVERDGGDLLCSFVLPPEEGREAELIVEISIYDMGNDGHVLSLEADGADNDAVWDAASELAEELAERLDAHELEL